MDTLCNWLKNQKNNKDKEKGKGKSKPGSKPKDAPPGTRPIDQSKYKDDHDAVEAIKKGAGAGPRDWTGIAPNGDVITSDPDGNTINNGPADTYLP